MSALARLISALSSRLDRNGHSRASRAIGVQARFAVRLPVRRQGEPQPVPAGQVDPRLGPREGPRDGPERIDRGSLVTPPARGGSRPEPQVGQLADRRDVAEERRETRVVVDERPVRRPRRGAELIEDRCPDGERPFESRGVLRGRGRQDRVRHLLEVASGDGRVRVVGGDDLALLGQLESAVDRARAPGRGSPGWSARRRARGRHRDRGTGSARRRASCAVSASVAWAWWSIQAAARKPDSLFESE